VSSEKHGLRHLASYLDAADQRDRLVRLLLADREWMDRKFAALEDDGPYLEDIQIALRHFADPLPASDLLVVAQLFAARRAVRLRGESSAAEDLVVLTLEGRLAAALARARLRAEPEDRCGNLLAIHRVLRRQGRIDLDLLNEIRDRAFAVAVHRERAYAFAALGEEMALSGLSDPARAAFDKAQEALVAIEPARLERIWVLQVLAGTQARAGFFPAALAVLRSIHDPFYLAWTLAQVAPSAPMPGKALPLFEKAESLASQLGDAGREAVVLQSLLEGFLALGLKYESHRMLRKLRNLARTDEVAIRTLVVGLAEMDLCQEAEEALKDLHEGRSRGVALGALAVAWARRRHWNPAEAVADDIAQPAERKGTLRRLAVLAAETNKHKTALRLLDKARTSPKLAPEQASLLLSTDEVFSGRPSNQPQVESSIPSPENAVQAKAKEAVRLAETGNEAAAKLLVHDLEATVWPITTRSDFLTWQTLALAYARLGDARRAHEILYELEGMRNLSFLDNLNRRDSARGAARLAAECGSFIQAFEMLEHVPSNMFPGELNEWAPVFERIGPDLAAAVESEVARILGWGDRVPGLD
jgi:tetratricopeptide (TPR) repeat protein